MIAVGIKKTDTDSNAEFNSDLKGIVGLVAVAAAMPKALNEGEATVVITRTGGLTSFAMMIAGAKLPGLAATSTPLVFRNEMPRRLVQT